MMTYRCTSVRRKSRGKVALIVLCGLILSFSLLPASIASAASSRTGDPALTTNGVLEQAGVSVVRLLASYKTKQNTLVSCTALGTLVASWPTTSSSERNNWVLTDSSMVSLTGGSCLKGAPLAGLQVWASSEYTNQSGAATILAELVCTAAGCRDQSVAGSGPAETLITSSDAPGGTLFSFHTNGLDMQPYLTSGVSGTTGTGIELANQADQWPQSSTVAATALQSFLTPAYFTEAPPSASTGTSVPTATPIKAEAGMPLVDNQGNLVGMQESGQSAVLSVNQLGVLETKAPEFANATLVSSRLKLNILKQNWDAGIQAYDAGSYALAAQTLNKIQAPAVDNPLFQAAAHFAQLATQKEQKQNSGNVSPSPSNSNRQGTGNLLGIPNSTILLVGLIAGVALLVLLLVLVSLVFGRRRTQHSKDRAEMARFKEEEAEARRDAELEARRIAGESRRGPQSPDETAITKPIVGNAPVAGFAAPFPPLPPPPMEAAPFVLPSQEVYGSASDETAAFDTPTVPVRKNGNGAPVQDGPLVHELHNVSLAVGFQSNVGIKRQHKPNEDSLFAMQGARTHNSQPQQFGLFVVADGMGGHANGQDASRLAIQTMIDFMLPRISVGNGAMDDTDYLKLLEEGVQNANQAVHHRNLEEHADMGTTMTTALVIGATAYVANVGDSRTYLYRQSLGLTKVTRDHSVVASLVDAGIIKPDDIYTHPKRNQIYRSLGEKLIIEVDTFKVDLQPGDKLLLCTDGLWDMVRDPAIQRIISTPEPNPNKTGEDLIQAALEGGGEDNVSVIVVSINESSGHTGITGVQLHTKPESVTVPDLPAM